MRLTRGHPKGKHVAGLVNAVARKVAAGGVPLWETASEAGLPDWLAGPVREAWGAAALEGIEALPERVTRDRELMMRCRALEAAWDRAVERRGLTSDLEDGVWMLQELRISLFAQSLGTKGTISEKRIRALLA